MRFFKKRTMLTAFIAFMVSMPPVWTTPGFAGGPMQKKNQIVNKNNLLAKKAARYKADEIIVKYKDGTSETAIRKLNQRSYNFV